MLRSRRALLPLAALAIAACGGAAAPGPAGTKAEALASTNHAPRTPIRHVVLVMMENRSFDHLLGWVPGADGKQAGLTYLDRSGRPHATHALAPDYQGCGKADPDHSYTGGRVEYDNGKNDGWLRAGQNDDFSIGYYQQQDLAFFGQAVRHWTTFDRYFAATMAETYPNRIYQHAAQTDRLVNTLTISTLPTIWDRLAEAGLQGRYYYSDVPFLALWGAKYLPISRPVGSFFADAAAGNLAEVTYIDPRFNDESSGTSGDDHPHADIRNGEAFLNAIYTAVVTSPEWKSTVLLINYDEWGGFYDHVSPPLRPIPPASAAAGDKDGRLGFRTAAMLVSPWAHATEVSHEHYDHTSLLSLIEWNWRLAPLTVRDATAQNLVEELDFTQRRGPAPLFAVPPGPFGAPCGVAAPAPAENDLAALQSLATSLGWPVGR